MSWMHRLVARDMGRGKITVPGSFDVVHAWAYLPDMAEAVVRLAEVEPDLAAYEVFHFDSHNLTARQLRDAADGCHHLRLRRAGQPDNSHAALRRSDHAHLRPGQPANRLRHERNLRLQRRWATDE